MLKISDNFIFGFDLDGVIIDSLPIMELSWITVCEKYNLNVPFAQYRENIGIPFKDILINLGIEEILYDELENDYFLETKQHQNEIKLFPYIRELIQELKSYNIKTFIVTSKPASNTHALLTSLDVSVDKIICADDVISGKPHPESGDKVRHFFGADKDVYYVGDMDSDRQFSVNCAFRFIFARYGYGSLNSAEGVYSEISSLKNIFECLVGNH
jgi:HAD superfamily hydrolase (TIGR01549 family)